MRSYLMIFASCMLLSTLSLSGADTTKIWVGTWVTGPQLVEPGNNPPSPGLTDNSLRQVVRVSIGGDTLRVKFSNQYSEDSVEIKAAKIAVSSGADAVYDSTSITLTFDGNAEIAMEPGMEIISDPIAYDLQPRMDLAITIYYGKTSETVTGHPGSRTTSYLITGNDTSMTDFSGAVTTDHWYNILGIDVLTPSTSTCVAVLGNSITDGRGSTTNMQNRWPDYLSNRFLANTGTENVGVLNLGIGGNCVINNCLGPRALDRYEHDILNQPGVRAAIIYEGVNDIGGISTRTSAANITNGLIEAYKIMIDSAHARGIFIYAATITPFKGFSYYNGYSESSRNIINEWIRNYDGFDAVIDFDKILRNPNDTASLVSSYQDDGLHIDTAGYRQMVDSIDLDLFRGMDTLFPVLDTSKIESFWFEPECLTVGENWKLYIDPQVSNKRFLTPEPGFNSVSEAPADSADAIYIPFSVTYDTIYHLYGRLNCPGTDDDSYWIKMDENDFVMYDELGTSGWEWKEITSYNLTAGEHTLTIAYSEDGAGMDKLCITSDTVAPTWLGKPAEIYCWSDTASPHIDGISDVVSGTNEYNLDQNYPNPFSDKTTIAFEIPHDTFVSLKVFSILGEEITELAGKEYISGRHSINFDASGLSKGIYFYTIKTDTYSASRKMIIQTE